MDKTRIEGLKKQLLLMEHLAKVLHAKKVISTISLKTIQAIVASGIRKVENIEE